MGALARDWCGIPSGIFAFLGFEDMSNVAQEVIDPVKTMPKAIILTLVLATVLYCDNNFCADRGATKHTYNWYSIPNLFLMLHLNV